MADLIAPVLCAVEGCSSLARTRGWCRPHYMRWWRHGGPARPHHRAPVLDRFWSKVQKTETCWLWIGGLERGYGRFGIERRQVFAHRFAYELLIGPIPNGLDLDHICRVTRCVRPEHLRPVVAKQNAENRLGPNRGKSSAGARGVCWNKDRQKWRVQVGHNGKVICGGYYADAADAERAAIALRLRLFTHNDADKA